MKTKVEIEGYEIEVEFENGIISVKAEKDEETVEEFTIEVVEGAQSQSEEEGSEEIQGFEDFGGEEDDFEGEEFEGGEESDEEFESEEEESEGTLESFQSFINKRKK